MLRRMGMRGTQNAMATELDYIRALKVRRVRIRTETAKCTPHTIGGGAGVPLVAATEVCTRGCEPLSCSLHNLTEYH